MVSTVYVLTLALQVHGQKGYQYDSIISEGRGLLERHQFTAAIAKFHQALNIDSQRVEAYYGLGVCYSTSCQETNSDCRIALKYLNQALGIKDDYRNAYFNRGRCYGTIGDYKSALKDFDKAVRQSPQDPEGYFYRALIKIKLKDNSGACQDFYHSALLGDETSKKMFEDNCGLKKK